MGVERPMRLAQALVAALATLLVIASSPNVASATAGSFPTVHTIFSTQCTPFFDWQSIVLTYSFLASGQPGKLTRLMSCKSEDLARVRQTRSAVFDIVDTFVTEDVEENRALGDTYSAYNKPYSIARWLEEAKPVADVILITDADMLLRAPMDPGELGVAPGKPVAAYYGYLKGVANAMADAIVPELPKLEDTKGGVVGRRADQVGTFNMLYREDLASFVDDYYKYTEKVRMDPNAWQTSGDVYAEQQGKGRVWISEMYGYAFAAAKHGIYHRASLTDQLYPGYPVVTVPRILHYGILWEVANTGFHWDKHWFRDFDPLACPPWPDQPWTKPFGADKAPKSGLFPTPPDPAKLTSQGQQRVTDLIALEPLIMADAALCWWHRRACPASPQLDELCGAVEGREKAFRRELEALGDMARVPVGSDSCRDSNSQCAGWARNRQCTENPGYMHQECRRSCGLCGGADGKASPVPAGGASGKGGGGGGANAADGVLPPRVPTHEDAYARGDGAGGSSGTGRGSSGGAGRGGGGGGEGSVGAAKAPELASHEQACGHGKGGSGVGDSKGGLSDAGSKGAGGARGSGASGAGGGRDADCKSPGKLQRTLVWGISVSVVGYLAYQAGKAHGRGLRGSANAGGAARGGWTGVDRLGGEGLAKFV